MKHSKSYIFFKNKIQEVFNFAVLVTNSVPTLKYNIKLFKEGKINRLPDPDYFEPSVVYVIKEETVNSLTRIGIEDTKIENLRKLIDKPLNNKEFKETVIGILGEETYTSHRHSLKIQSKDYINNLSDCSTNYQSKLATYLYFSTFSYFEAFICDITREIIESMKVLDNVHYINTYHISPDVVNDRIKLDNEFDSRKKDRYVKYSKKLRSSGYKPPEEVLYSSLIELLRSKIDDLKANEIPVFLEKTLRYQLTEDEKLVYHTLRTNRNSIGHGDNSFKPCLKDVIAANKFFKRLSANIDKHVSFFFLNLTNYQTD